MNPELWGQIVIPLSLATVCYLGHQIRVLHARISRRDDRIRALDEKFSAAHREISERLATIEATLKVTANL